MRLRKRNGTWHAEWWEHQPDGTRIRKRKGTGTAVRSTAQTIGEQWERDSADPDHARARGTTVNDALQLLLRARFSEAHANPPKCSMATLTFYTSKAGHLNRLLGPATLLASVHADTVDAYIEARRLEWADEKRTRHVSEHTISKELVTLRAALKLAKRARVWRGDPAAVIPVAFAPEYKPRDRAPTLEELQKLLGAFTRKTGRGGYQPSPDHAARVAFMYATSCEWSASDRAERSDVARDRAAVLIRGSKRDTRWRTVPLVSDVQRSLVQYALDHAEGVDGKLFAPWGNVRHGLRKACERAGIPYVTPNDLRRATAHMLKLAGASHELIAPVMGHADTRMLDRVYGRAAPSELATMLARAMGFKRVTPASQTHRTRADAMDESDASDTGDGEKSVAVSRDAVPRDGIEPPTRGFSVPVPLWPSPGKTQSKRGRPLVRVTRASHAIEARPVTMSRGAKGGRP